jgi:hypothetical protein
MPPQPKMPPELAIENRYSNDYGPMYLAMILKCWCSSDRDDNLGPTLRVLIDCELFWVVDDVLEGCSHHDQILIAEEALHKFSHQALKKMLAIANRKVSKAKNNRYQGVEVTDLRLSGIMSMFVILIDQAHVYVMEELTSENSQPIRISPPK